MNFITENLWLYLGVVTLIVCGGAVLLITTGYANRLWDWMKPDSSKSLPVKVFCEDGQIRDRKLEVGRYVISDHNNRRAFYLVRKLRLAGSDGKASFLALTERSARPIDFHNRMTADDWSDFPSGQDVFLDTTADIRSEAAKEASGNFMMQSLTIMVLGVAVIVVVMGIIIFFQQRGPSL